MASVPAVNCWATIIRPLCGLRTYFLGAAGPSSRAARQPDSERRGSRNSHLRLKSPSTNRKLFIYKADDTDPTLKFFSTAAGYLPN
jgi:hypothetical protein